MRTLYIFLIILNVFYFLLIVLTFLHYTFFQPRNLNLANNSKPLLPLSTKNQSDNGFTIIG